MVFSTLPRRFIYWGLRRLSNWQDRIQRRLTPLGRFTLNAGIAAGVLGVDTRLNLLHQAFTFAMTLLLVGGASATLAQFRLRKRFSGNRELPRYAVVGQAVSYWVNLRVEPGNRGAATSTKSLPGFESFSVQEQLPDPRPSLQTFLHARVEDDRRVNRFDRALGYPRWRRLIRLGSWAEASPGQPLAEPAERGKVRQRISLHPLRRGQLRLAGLRLTRPDPLGVFRLELRLPCPQSLLVLPPLHPVPRLNLPGRRRYQPGGVAMASSIGDSREFIGLREYRSGDSPRDIHWPSWARSGKPQVKEYQDEFFTRHALLLDTFSKLEFDPAFEAAVSAAASLCGAIRDGESLLDLMFVGADTYCFTAGRGLAGLEQFLEILACTQPCTDQPFEKLHQSVLQRAGLLSSAVCVLLDFDASRRRLVQGLRATGLPLLVLLVAEEARAGEMLSGWEGEPPRLIRPERLVQDLAAL